MIRRPPRSTRTDTLFPYTTLFRSFALFVFAADQVLKWFIIGPLNLRAVGTIHLLPIFDLTWTENRGVSMGFLTAGSDMERWLLVGFTATIATVVAVWLWRERRMGRSAERRVGKGGVGSGRSRWVQ